MALALRYVLINISAAFLTEPPPFSSDAECESPALLRKGRNKHYLCGHLLVNYSPSVAVVGDWEEALGPRGGF